MTVLTSQRDEAVTYDKGTRPRKGYSKKSLTKRCEIKKTKIDKKQNTRIKY